MKVALGIKAEDPTENLEYYDDDMEECANDYAIYITEIVANEKSAGMFLLSKVTTSMLNKNSAHLMKKAVEKAYSVYRNIGGNGVITVYYN